MFFNQFDTILLITDSISMKSDFNKIDNNKINNKISYLINKYDFQYLFIPSMHMYPGGCVSYENIVLYLKSEC